MIGSEAPEALDKNIKYSSKQEKNKFFFKPDALEAAVTRR